MNLSSDSKMGRLRYEEKRAGPRQKELQEEIARRTERFDGEAINLLIEPAIEERVEVVLARLDRLINHGYDHNFNCTNFNGDRVNLIHAGRGPRLQLHSDGSLWVHSRSNIDEVIEANDVTGFEHFIKSVKKANVIQIAWYRLIYRHGGLLVSLLFFMWAAVALVKQLVS